MSIAEMSATLRKEILARLKEQYASVSSGRTPEARLASFLDYTSTERIRSDTDSGKRGHESIMSRGGFEALSQQLSNVLHKSALNSIVAKSLSSDITFDNFKDYLINDVKLNYAGNKRIAGNFAYTGVSRTSKTPGLTYASELGADASDKDVLILRNIPIGNLVDYYSKFLVSKFGVAPGVSETEAIKEVKALFNAGHLTGAFNARLVRALGLRKNVSGNIVFDSSKHDSLASHAEVELNKIMSLITDADYLSSNIVNDIDLFATTDKRLYKNKVNLKLTTEVQFADTNKRAGDLLTQAGHAISDLTKAVKSGTSEAGQEAAVGKALTKLYTNLANLAKEVRAKAQAYKALDSKLRKEAQANLDRVLKNVDAIEAIISSPGSKSMPEHIEHLVVCALKGIQSTAGASKALVKDSLPKPTGKKPVQSKLAVPKKNTKLSVSSKSKSTVTTPNLSSLQNFINLHLQDVISANMGDGNRKDILNYRTGRFAASARVERLTQSREGMITAFYSYMKNPYATFSHGGKQQYPRSRDPKLLISKSIREAAGEQVANRLRAVVV